MARDQRSGEELTAVVGDEEQNEDRRGRSGDVGGGR